MVIHVPPDLEQSLRTVADQIGKDPESVAVDALRRRFAHIDSDLTPRDDWEAGILSVGKPCGVSLSDHDVSSEGIYE